MKTLRLPSIIFTLLLLSSSVWGKVVIKDLKYSELNKSTGKLLVYLDGDIKDIPEISFRDKMFQLVMRDTVVWPKIEKRASVATPIDTTLMAYQFTKDTVRVRTLLPFTIQNTDKVNVLLNKNAIEVRFPLPGSIAKTTVSKKKKNQVKEKENYDLSFLNTLLKEKKEEKELPNKLKKDFDEKSIENQLVDMGKKTDPKKEKDQVATKQAALDKSIASKSSFSLGKYVGKFVAFLAIILLGFLVVVTLFKKGLFKKNNLKFLKNTELVTVLNTTYIGPKRSLILIKAHNRVLLIGNSENGLSYISEMDDISQILKTNEKDIAGDNFDQKVNEAKDVDFKLKGDITKSKNADLTSFLNVAKSTKPRRDKFSDQLKQKVKGLKPLQ
jgi:flagellar biogenesis protein FliO